MALSNEEKQILEYAKANGKTPLEAKTAIAKFRSEQASVTTPNQPTEAISEPISNKVTGALGLGGATNIFGRMANTFIAKYPNSPLSKIVGQNEGQKKVEELTKKTRSEILSAGVQAPTGKEMAGATLQTAAIPLGAAITGGSSLAGQVAAGAAAGYAYDVGQDLIEKKSAGEVLKPGMATVIGAGAPLAVKGLTAGVGALSKPATQVVDAVTQSVPDSTLVQGAKQSVSDVAERVPRFVGRVSEAVKDQAVKAEKIRTSSPVVAQALKVDLPEQFIEPVRQANPVTKQAFKRVLDIADAPKKTLGQKSNPSIVAGELATKQFDVIDAQRKTIGKALNEATAKLSKTEPIPMQAAYSQLDNLLSEQGITPTYSNTGVKLDFSKSKLAPKQRQVVQDLYKLATEGGDTLTPTEIHRKDQLFSALQREARADQIEDIRIDLPDGGNTSLFRAFRDVYANELDTLSPEIKDLNRKYRNIMTLIEDVEDSIFKTPDFNITKSTDQAEFAKVNLRRIFGEAQSSPVYEVIADEMDAISRQLGYTDASPKEVAAFAQEIRALYPETIPKTGFQGGIRGAVTDIASRVLEAGRADTTDQRKALRALLEATESVQ